MKRFFALAVVLVLLFAVFASPTMAEAAPGRYVVLYNANKLPAGFQANIEAAGGQLARSFPELGIAVVVSDSATFVEDMSSFRSVMSVGAAPAYSLPDTVEFAFEPDGPTAADIYYNSGQLWGIQRVEAPAAWDAGYTGSHDTVVAVIDTGVAWNHPDLAPNVVYVDCFTSAGSFATGDCNPYPSLSDHGTHVAGTVAGAFDGGRVVGVGPDLGIAGYNVFENIPGCGVCAYSDSRWAAMMDAAQRGFQVESMSLGGTGVYGGQGTFDLATYVAAEIRVANYINSMGTVMVASAGNSGLDLNGPIVHVPGDVPNMINVGATGIQPVPLFPYAGSYDIRAFYSNFGAAVDISAPGGDCGEISSCSGNPGTGYNWFDYLILSSVVDANPTCAATYSCPVGYGWKGGTSMATPHVSGAAALVMDANPGLTPNQVEAILMRTAEKIGSRQEFGHGMVNVYAAVMEALP